MPSDFKKLILARFLFTFAVQMQAIVLGWRIYQLLNDPLALGLIGLTEAVPAIGLALIAGYIIDRSRPLIVYRRVMMISFLSGLIVLIEHIFSDFLNLHQQVGMLYFAAFLTGSARAFSMPAIFATVPRLVERHQLMRASAISSSVMQSARVLGPAAGGLIFGFFGNTACSSIVCLCLALGSCAMLLIQKKLEVLSTSARHSSIAAELTSGLKFVFNHSVLLPALSLDMISVLFGGVTSLLPIFAGEILMVGPQGLGMLRAAPAVGAVVTTIYLGRRPLAGSSGPWLFVGVGGFGLCILVFGMSSIFWVSLLALAFSGAFDAVSAVIRSTAVQLMSPDHMRGKISAVNSIFIGSSNEIGEFESGVAAKFLGPVASVYLGGCVCLLTVIAVAILSPTLRRLNLNDHLKTDSV